MQKVEWREVFNRQPVHFLLLDISHPMTNDILSNVCDSLQNVFALAVSLKGSSRLPAFGFSLLGSNADCVIKLQQLKLNYENILQTLQETGRKGCTISANNTCDKICLSKAFQEAIQQYRDYYHAFTDEKRPQLQITMISAKHGQWVLRNVQSVLEDTDLILFRKVHVVAIITDSQNENILETHPSIPGSSPFPWSPCNNDTVSSSVEATVEFTAFKYTYYQIEGLFKSWLHDFSTDKEHLNIVLENGIGSQATLKCDLQECLVNPELLPSSSQYLLSVDSGFTQFVTPNRAKAVANKVPVFCLESVALLKLGGICESMTFGNPMVMYATECWKIEWEELETNSQLFAALNKKLTEKDSALLVRRKADIFLTKKTNPENSVQGFYIIMPSGEDNCFMLIRSVATMELIFPSKLDSSSSSDVVKVEEKALHFVDECLSMLDVEERFNPLMLSSQLYPQLLISISKNKVNRNKI